MGNQPTNIGTAENKVRTPLKNRSSSQNIYDKIRSYLAEAGKKASEIGTSGKFFGFVLYSNPLTVDQFKELFKNNKEFLDDVIIEGSNSVNTKSSAEVVEMYVYVPQLTDFLPEPDIGLLNKFIDLKNEKTVTDLLEKQRAEFDALGKLIEPEQVQTESAPSSELGPPPLSSHSITPAMRKRLKRDQEAKRIYEKLRETLNIITMYPKVYKYTENKSYYAPGTACEVHFPNDIQKSMLSMGYGVFKKELQGTIFFGDSEAGLLDAIVEREKTA